MRNTLSESRIGAEDAEGRQAGGVLFGAGSVISYRSRV